LVLEVQDAPWGWFVEKPKHVGAYVVLT
jgi:hypothetical protein